MQTSYRQENGQTVSFRSNGKPYIHREKFKPPKNKNRIPDPQKEHPLAFMFEDKELGMIGVILGAVLIIWLGLFILPTLIVCLLPVRAVWVRAFRYLPRPPGRVFFFLLVCLATIVPGFLGGLGIFVLWLMVVVRLFLHFGVFTNIVDFHSNVDPFNQLFDHFFRSVPIPAGLLRTMAHDRPLLLAAGMVPAYLVAIFYIFIWVKACDRRVIKVYYDELEQRRLAAEEKEVRLQACEEEQRQAEIREVSSGRAIDLGEVLERTWDLKTMRWITGPGPRGSGNRALLTHRHLMRHLIVIGPTRMGKTLNIILPLLRFCRKNRTAAIFFDPKGYEIPDNEAGLVFSLQPRDRASSFRLCLVDRELEFTDRANNLAEALIDSDNPGEEAQYFISSGRLALSALLRSHYLVFGQYPELNEVLAYTNDPTKAANVRAKLKQLIEDPTRTAALRRFAEEADSALAEVERRIDSKADPLGTMYNALRPLAEGKYRDYLTTNPKSGLSIRQILQKRLVTRIALTSIEGDIGRAIGRVVIRQFTSAVLDPSSDKSFPKLLVIDEAHNYVCKALETGITQAAGNNAAYVLAFQSLEEIRNPALRSVIFSNCRNKIVLKGVEGQEDAGRFSRLFGQEDLPYLSTSNGSSEGQTRGTNWSEGRNRSNSRSSTLTGGGSSSQGYSYGGSLGENKSQSTTRNTGERINYQTRPRWLPGEIGAIPYFHAIAYLDDGGTEPEPLLIKFTDPDRRRAMEPVLPVVIKEQLDPAFMVAVATYQAKPEPGPANGSSTSARVAHTPSIRPAPPVQPKPPAVNNIRPGGPGVPQPHLVNPEAALPVTPGSGGTAPIQAPAARPGFKIKMTVPAGPPEPGVVQPAAQVQSQPVEEEPAPRANPTPVLGGEVIPLCELEPAPKAKPARGRGRGRPKKAKPEPPDLPPAEPGEL